MKYFFLSDSWTTGRVWEFGGLWNEVARRCRPYLEKQPLCIQENGETLCLYETEDAVLMVEVVPKAETHSMIGQVVLKRLLTAEQLIERLCQEETVFHLANIPARSADNFGVDTQTPTEAPENASETFKENPSAEPPSAQSSADRPAMGRSATNAF